MPIIKSAIKRVRQQVKRRSHNLQIKRAIHTNIRTFTDAVDAGDARVVNEALVAAVSEIDRAVKKGTLHRNTAARRKSQLQKQANNLGVPAPAAKKPIKKTAVPTKAKATPKAKSVAKPKAAPKSAK